MGAIISTCILVRLDGTQPDAVGTLPMGVICDNDVSTRPNADAMLFTDVLGLTPAPDAQIMLQLTSNSSDPELALQDPIWVSVPTTTTYAEFATFLNAATNQGPNSECWYPININSMITFYDFGGVNAKTADAKRAALVSSVLGVSVVVLAGGLAAMVAQRALQGRVASTTASLGTESDELLTVTESVPADRRSRNVVRSGIGALIGALIGSLIVIALVAVSARCAATAVDATAQRVPTSVSMSTFATGTWEVIVRGGAPAPTVGSKSKLAQASQLKRELVLVQDGSAALQVVRQYGNSIRREEQRKALAAKRVTAAPRYAVRGSMLTPAAADLMSFAHAFARGEISQTTSTSVAAKQAKMNVGKGEQGGQGGLSGERASSSARIAYSAPVIDDADSVRSIKVYADERFIVELGWISPNARVPTHTHPTDVAVIPLSSHMTLELQAPDRTIVDAVVGQPYHVPSGIRHSASVGPDGGHFFAVFAPLQAGATTLLSDI